MTLTRDCLKMISFFLVSLKNYSQFHSLSVYDVFLLIRALLSELISFLLDEGISSPLAIDLIERNATRLSHRNEVRLDALIPKVYNFVNYYLLTLWSVFEQFLSPSLGKLDTNVL